MDSSALLESKLENSERILARKMENLQENLAQLVSHELDQKLESVFARVLESVLPSLLEQSIAATSSKLSISTATTPSTTGAVDSLSSSSSTTTTTAMMTTGSLSGSSSSANHSSAGSNRTSTTMEAVTSRAILDCKDQIFQLKDLTKSLLTSQESLKTELLDSVSRVERDVLEIKQVGVRAACLASENNTASFEEKDVGGGGGAGGPSTGADQAVAAIPTPQRHNGPKPEDIAAFRNDHMGRLSDLLESSTSEQRLSGRDGSGATEDLQGGQQQNNGTLPGGKMPGKKRSGVIEEAEDQHNAGLAAMTAGGMAGVTGAGAAKLQTPVLPSRPGSTVSEGMFAPWGFEGMSSAGSSVAGGEQIGKGAGMMHQQFGGGVMGAGMAGVAGGGMGGVGAASMQMMQQGGPPGGMPASMQGGVGPAGMMNPMGMQQMMSGANNMQPGFEPAEFGSYQQQMNGGAGFQPAGEQMMTGTGGPPHQHQMNQMMPPGGGPQQHPMNQQPGGGGYSYMPGATTGVAPTGAGQGGPMTMSAGAGGGFAMAGAVGGASGMSSMMNNPQYNKVRCLVRTRMLSGRRFVPKSIFKKFPNLP